MAVKQHNNGGKAALEARIRDASQREALAILADPKSDRAIRDAAERYVAGDGSATMDVASAPKAVRDSLDVFLRWKFFGDVPEYAYPNGCARCNEYGDEDLRAARGEATRRAIAADIKAEEAKPAAIETEPDEPDEEPVAMVEPKAEPAKPEPAVAHVMPRDPAKLRRRQAQRGF
ncbi:MAG TPA: hypothetical protein VGL61_06475 [Kofleriaceae bacterium]|jgi:hypothetical protein